MRRLVVLGMVVGIVTAACADRAPVAAGPVSDGSSKSSPSAGDVPSPGATGSDAPQPSEGTGPSTGTLTYEVWFQHGEGLFATQRTQEPTRAVGAASLDALLRGPTPGEAALGIGSSIPQGTELLGLSIEDGMATVDLSDRFESGGGSASMTMRLAQVVYTITQFDSMDEVLFRLDGHPVEVFSGEGIVLGHAVGRDEYAELLPAILVEAPTIGERVSSPVLVTGTADVFEANVTVRILDADGRELAGTVTLATCGTGCRGDFSVRLAYRVDHEERGFLQVTDDDAAGTGTPPHVVEIPITLTP